MAGILAEDMGVPLETRRANLDESSYDFSGQTKGRRTIDNPRNQLSIWNKYDFTTGALKGLDLGLGAQFNGQRQSEVLLTNGARTTEGVENVRQMRALAALGAELCRANLDDPGSLMPALAGARAVFGVTNFWEHGDPLRELRQAAYLAAAAVLVIPTIAVAIPWLTGLRQLLST